MTGNYKHTIDAKGRLFIPAKLRDELGGRFYVTKGLDNCLFVYPEPVWKEIEAQMMKLPLSKSRDLQRGLFAPAELCEPDSQWRIVVPQRLRAYAKLEKDVTVLGVGNRAEIWDTEKWDTIDESFDADTMADAMDSLGF